MGSNKSNDRQTRLAAGAARVLAELAGGAEPLDLKAVAKLPEMKRPGGKRVSFRTLWRWLADARLDSAEQFGRRITTHAAVRRTLAASNAVTPAAIATPKQRSRELDRLEKRLAAAGI